VPGVEVSILAAAYRFGRREARSPSRGFLATLDGITSEPGETDAEGRYVISGIPPDRYYVRVDLAPTQSDRRDPLYARYLYYPGVEAPDQAVALAFRGGEDVSADIRIPEREGVRVSGTILLPFGDGQVFPNGEISRGVTASFLVPRHFESLETPYSLIHRDGAAVGDEVRFRIDGVPPGEYDFYPIYPVGGGEALSTRYSAPTRIAVGARDVEDVSVVVRPGVELRGRVTIRDAEPSDLREVENLTVLLEPRQAMPGLLLPSGGPLPRTDAGGEFVFPNLYDGRYQIRLSRIPAGFHLADIRQGARTAYGDATIEVGAAAPEPVEIVLARGVARIDGRVTDGAGTPVAGAEVVLVPEPPLSENFMLFANATSREDGRFSAARLAPGRYRAYAFSFDPATAQMNAAWLLAYVRFGVPVAVEPSSTSSVELRLVPEALGR
jgi:hypothetical protein